MDYRHICADHPYAPELFFPAVNEAINIFLRKERGSDALKFHHKSDHLLSVADLSEITDYVDKIWSNKEIYYIIGE